jgi:hypothetical protein
METILIEILDEKAKPLLDNLVKRNLIKIKKSVKSPKLNPNQFLILPDFGKKEMLITLN